MISFQWQRDPALVEATITHPAVWPWIAFEGQAADAFRAPAHMAFASVMDGETYLGMFGFEALSQQSVKAHIYLLPAARGRGAELGQAVIAWLVDQDQDQELSLLVGETPVGNRLALACLRKIGFQEVGRLTGAVTQQGKVQDLVISQFIVRR